MGGLGASLLLPAMQSLIHGNFEGAQQRRVYALVGAAAAIAAAVGPLIGGFITTYLSWRVAFLLEAVIIAIVLSGIGLVKDAPYTGKREIDSVGGVLSVFGMGGIVLGILAWQEGGESVGLLLVVGAVALAAFACWLVRRKRAGQGRAHRSGPLHVEAVPVRHHRPAAPADRPGRHDDRPADLPPDGPRVQRDAGRPLDRAAVAEHVRGRHPGREAGRRSPPELASSAPGSCCCSSVWPCSCPLVPRADAGWYLFVPLVIAGSGLGLLVSQLNNYTLAPISEERVSEAAGVNSAAGSFGLSFGLAFAGAIMLATLAFSFTSMSDAQRGPRPEEQQQVATALEDDAQIMSDTQLADVLVGQPADVQAEIIRINTDARPSPCRWPCWSRSSPAPSASRRRSG